VVEGASEGEEGGVVVTVIRGCRVESLEIPSTYLVDGRNDQIVHTETLSS